MYGSAGYENYGDSEETAWEIDSLETLVKFRDDVNSGKLDYEHYIKLTSDIDLGNYTGGQWTPIGGAQNADTLLDFYHFKGHFDGCNHTITVNINVSGQGVDTRHHEAGLFGVISGGSVRNLRVSGNVKGGATYSTFKYNTDPTLYVGGVACILEYGTIDNCSFNGNIELGVRSSTECSSACFAHAGGIVAEAGSFNAGPVTLYINNCRVGSTAAAKISVTSNIGHWPSVGGIAGSLFLPGDSTISGNYVSTQFVNAGDGKISSGDIYGAFSGGNEANVYGNIVAPPPNQKIV